MPLDSLESQPVKRQRLSDLRQQQPPVNGLLNNKGGRDNAPSTLNPSFHVKTEFERTSNHIVNQNGFLGSQNGFPLMHKLSSAPDTPVLETREQEPKLNNNKPPQGDSDCTHQQLTNNQHRKKKSKKHKDKEREQIKDNQGSEWLETSPDLKQNPDKLDSKRRFTQLKISASSPLSKFDRSLILPQGAALLLLPFVGNMTRMLQSRTKKMQYRDTVSPRPHQDCCVHGVLCARHSAVITNVAVRFCLSGVSPAHVAPE